MTIFIRNKCHGYYFLALLLFNSSTLCSMERMSDAETCDADDDVAITNLYAQVQQCLRANHNLTENMAKLNHQFQQVQGKLEDIAKLNHQFEEIQGKLEDIAKLNHQFEEIQGKLEENQRELLRKIVQSGRQDIVIQRRMDGSVDFYRTWNEYKVGFGDSSGEFFIGLDKLHELTNRRRHELLIDMEDWEGERRYAKYDYFVVGSESEKYKLKSLGNYTGTAGDSLTYSKDEKFSTKDQDNDQNTNGNCAVMRKGAWWYYSCTYSNLNGPYKKGQVPDDERGQIVQWVAFKGKFVEMTIRPN